MSGTRWWAFRLLTSFALPVALLAGLEIALRLGAVGNSPDFFVPLGSGEAYTTNQHFGQRFFPPAIARTPQITVLERPKPEGTTRIFLLGGSAAMGTPDASFGLARQLEVLLRQRSPKQNFEVVNAAMTAVNSHVVRVIAQDCLLFEPDLLVLFVGNNEVIGPYGPGTVFDSFSSSLAVIRLSVWISGTRIGQLADRLATRLSRGHSELASWEGLEMFVDRVISRDDPRLAAAYDHFEANLRDTIAAARKQGVPVLLTTVAVNLRHQPPFAAIPADLEEGERRFVDELFASSGERLSNGDPIEAIRLSLNALEADPENADMHFRLASAFDQADREELARRHYQLAVDTDGLRFRADSRINELIRTLATEPGASLVDAEQRLAAATDSSPGLPGNELFFEHVHLRFEGNHKLAILLLEEIERRLPAVGRATAEVASTSETARALGLGRWHRFQMDDAIGRMKARPPFLGSSELDALRRRRRLSRSRLERRARETLADDEEISRLALAARPDDLLLRANLAEILAARGELGEAIAETRALLRTVPGILQWTSDLALLLARQSRYAEAVALLQEVVERSPGDDRPLVNLGFVLEQSGDLEAAADRYEAAVALRSGSLQAYYNLGSVRERQQRWSEAAEIFREAIRVGPGDGMPYFRLAAVRERQNRLSEAIELYRAALDRRPEMAAAHNNLGYALERLGDLGSAMQSYRRGIAADPGYAMAHFNLADALLATGLLEEAVRVYQTALALDPANEQGRENLETAKRMATETGPSPPPESGCR